MIVIHAPPRVGGFSMRHVCSDKLRIRTHHVHYLHNENLYQDKSMARAAILRQGLENWKVISLVRDPIARNLSEYWRRWFIDRPGYEDASIMRNEQGIRSRPGTDLDRFNAYVDHYRQHQFVGSELKFWGIDIFSQPFEPPFTIYDDRLLIIRTEDLTKHGREALSCFIGVDTDLTPFPKKNVVPVDRERIDLTEAYIDAMFQDEYFPKWFYNDDEIERMKEKWMISTHRR